MQALVFDIQLAKVAAVRALGGKRGARLAASGPLSGLSLRELPEPPLPGKAWARIQVRSCGLCGTDISNFTYRTSPSLSPWGSFPCVPGHEILGTVVEVGPDVKTARVGDRVAVDPMLGCAARELPPCPSCAAGRPALCERQVGGPIPGMILGATAALPGGFTERLVAHDSQLVPVPEALPEDVAALLEPLSIGVHALLRRPPREGERVLVIGSGAIALSCIAAVRLLGHGNDVTAVVRSARQGELATELGADRAVHARGAALEEELARIAGARLFKPILGPRVGVGGFELAIDAAGNAESLSLALRLARAGGALTLVGAAGELPKIDLAFLWAKELDVAGAVGYGAEHVAGRDARTWTWTVGAALASSLPLAKLVSQRVPLTGYAQALRDNLDRDRSGVVKTLFVPGTGASR